MLNSYISIRAQQNIRAKTCKVLIYPDRRKAVLRVWLIGLKFEVGRWPVNPITVFVSDIVELDEFEEPSGFTVFFR